MTTMRFNYQFHAVGQGLFATGRLHDVDGNRRFHWVFDCGSSSRRSYVQREIARFRPALNGDPIGLLCLSHFDEDHINGASELLTRHRVGVMVMPYFPLVERMQIAFGTPGISDEYLRFLVDPAGYMFEAAGDNLREIILIEGGGSPSEESEESAPQNPPNSPDNDWDLHFPDTKRPVPPANEDMHGVSDAGARPTVRVFGHQKPFTVGGMWEFLFYNEHISATVAEALREEVAGIIRKYGKEDGTFDGMGLLRELKPLYIRTFGASGYSQNRISLIAYSGPVGRPNVSFAGLCGHLHPVGMNRHALCACGYYFPRRVTTKVSIGYFGDFSLTSQTKVHDVSRHFRPWRWNRLQVIQIPHHGSEHSWYNGASAEFGHNASVISSARHSDHHPSQSVLDDLDSHGLMLVNELQRASFSGKVDYR